MPILSVGCQNTLCARLPPACADPRGAATPHSHPLVSHFVTGRSRWSQRPLTSQCSSCALCRPPLVRRLHPHGLPPGAGRGWVGAARPSGGAQCTGCWSCGFVGRATALHGRALRSKTVPTPPPPPPSLVGVMVSTASHFSSPPPPPLCTHQMLPPNRCSNRRYPPLQPLLRRRATET